MGGLRELLILMFKKGLGPSLHIVQIASYEEMNPLRKGQV